MGWMAPLRHLSRCQSAGWSEPISGQGAIHERDYDGRLTCGQRLHRAEADITKRGNRSGFDPNADIGLLLTRQQHALGFSTFQVCPKDPRPSPGRLLMRQTACTRRFQLL